MSERPIDRVAAAGATKNEVGILVWKTKYGLEKSAYDALTAKTLEIYRDRYSDRVEVAQAVVTQAIHEWFAPECLTCQGKGSVLHSERIVACPDCSESSGVRIYTDAARSTLMGLGYGLTKKLSHKINWITGFLNRQDRLINAQVSVQLER